MALKHDRDRKDASSRPTSLRANLVSVIGAVLVVAVGVLGIMWLSKLAGDPESAPAAQTSSEEPGKPAKVQKLTESTTHSVLNGTTPDPHPDSRTEGDIVRPKKVIAIHAEPGGKPVGKVGPNQIGETWLPVIDTHGKWVRVLLPSRPNGSTGWLKRAHVEQKFTPYLITVHLKSMRIQLFFENREVGNWEIGIGKPDTPTPTGRTFLLGSFSDSNQKYSPVILPLGAHSDTLNSFGGGPGTVAIHTWPTTDVLGKATSHGCIRVPREALDRLTQVPLGTLVLVDQQ